MGGTGFHSWRSGPNLKANTSKAHPPTVEHYVFPVLVHFWVSKGLLEPQDLSQNLLTQLRPETFTGLETLEFLGAAAGGSMIFPAMMISIMSDNKQVTLERSTMFYG